MVVTDLAYKNVYQWLLQRHSKGLAEEAAAALAAAQTAARAAAPSSPSKRWSEP